MRLNGLARLDALRTLSGWNVSTHLRSLPLAIAAACALTFMLALALAVPGCRAHSDAAESPRNASSLQAEMPAATAVRGEGVESLLTGGRSATDSASPAGSGGTGADGNGDTGASADNWHIISQSFNLFRHGPYVVDLLLGFAFALGMALLLTAWPKSLVARDPVEAADERNGAVIVALVGCLAAELVQSSERLSLGAEIALVLFGIGGLIRFRTVFGDPRRTGLMILITILGLCCGMSQYALAVLAFLVIWLVRYYLLSSVRLMINVRVAKGVDGEQVRVVAASAIQAHGATIVQSQVRKGGRTIQITARAKGSVSESDLQIAIEDVLPDARVRVSAS